MSGDNCLICHTNKKTRIRLNCCQQTGVWICHDCFKSDGGKICPRCGQSVELVSKVKNVCSKPCMDLIVFLGIGLYLTQLILTGVYGEAVDEMCNNSQTDKHCHLKENVNHALMATYICFAFAFGLSEFCSVIMLFVGLEHHIEETSYVCHSNFYFRGYYYIPSLLWEMRGLKFPRNFSGFVISNTIYTITRMILYVALCSYWTNQGPNDKYYITMIIAYFGGHVVQYICLPVLFGLICLICSGSSDVFEAELQLIDGSSVTATEIDANETGQRADDNTDQGAEYETHQGADDETGQREDDDETDQKADRDMRPIPV